MAKKCDLCGGKVGMLLAFQIKDGTICEGCHDRLEIAIGIMDLPNKYNDFQLSEAAAFLEEYETSNKYSAMSREPYNSVNPDENGMIQCAYCGKLVKSGVMNSNPIKDGRICFDCTHRIWDAWKLSKKIARGMSSYTVNDIEALLNKYEREKDDLSRNNSDSTLNENTSSLKDGVKSFFRNVGDNMLKQKADKAIAEAYHIEQEKRKPHIKRIPHQRPLTQEEMQTIDLLEMEAQRQGQIQLNRMNERMNSKKKDDGFSPFMNMVFTLSETDRKIKEIKKRAVWYEEVPVPPEIDPSTPIYVDEDAIRRQIYGDRYQAIIDQNK